MHGRDAAARHDRNQCRTGRLEGGDQNTGRLVPGADESDPDIGIGASGRRTEPHRALQQLLVRHLLARRVLQQDADGRFRAPHTLVGRLSIGNRCAMSGFTSSRPSAMSSLANESHCSVQPKISHKLGL
jgi:hypothetical protein